MHATSSGLIYLPFIFLRIEYNNAASVEMDPSTDIFFSPQSTLLQWRLVFWITLVVFLVTNLVFVAWASADEQWWNRTRENPKLKEAEAATQKTVIEEKL